MKDAAYWLSEIDRLFDEADAFETHKGILNKLRILMRDSIEEEERNKEDVSDEDL